MKPKRLCSVVSALFLAVFMLFSGALPAKAAAALFEPANYVLIRGGEFTMGSPAGEVDHQNNETQHQVRLSSFYMSKYAVSLADFRSFVDATGYQTDAEKNGPYYVSELYTNSNWRTVLAGSVRPKSEENHPVYYVSWNDAMAYCKWLSAKTGKHFRLPTEAEREYACRAGSRTPFNTGENLMTNQANFDGNYPYNGNPKGVYRQNTVPVDSFAPNAWGLYNMHGNVWEWCIDWSDGTYYDECKANGTVTNPAGPATGSYRVLRGGSWCNLAVNCRSANRAVDPPDCRNNYVGFRPVFVP